MLSYTREGQGACLRPYILDEIIIQVELLQAGQVPESVPVDGGDPVLREVDLLQVPQVLEGVLLDPGGGREVVYCVKLIYINCN